jgi:hypothetical protein
MESKHWMLLICHLSPFEIVSFWDHQSDFVTELIWEIRFSFEEFARMYLCKCLLDSFPFLLRHTARLHFPVFFACDHAQAWKVAKVMDGTIMHGSKSLLYHHSGSFSSLPAGCMPEIQEQAALLPSRIFCDNDSFSLLCSMEAMCLLSTENEADVT